MYGVYPNEVPKRTVCAKIVLQIRSIYIKYFYLLILSKTYIVLVNLSKIYYFYTCSCEKYILYKYTFSKYTYI